MIVAPGISKKIKLVFADDPDTLSRKGSVAEEYGIPVLSYKHARKVILSTARFDSTAYTPGLRDSRTPPTPSGQQGNVFVTPPTAKIPPYVAQTPPPQSETDEQSPQHPTINYTRSQEPHNRAQPPPYNNTGGMPYPAPHPQQYHPPHPQQHFSNQPPAPQMSHAEASEFFQKQTKRSITNRIIFAYFLCLIPFGFQWFPVGRHGFGAFFVSFALFMPTLLFALDLRELNTVWGTILLIQLLTSLFMIPKLAKETVLEKQKARQVAAWGRSGAFYG